mgnify:CR=1 FL=1|jgi:hypothetical protein
MSVDPLAHRTFESYQYTGNNPINLIDVKGRAVNGNPGDPKKPTVITITYNYTTYDSKIPFYDMIRSFNGTYTELTTQEITGAKR